MAVGLWAEVWTRPGDPNFGRVIDDPIAIDWSFHDGVNQIGDGTLNIPDSFDRFDEILLTDPDTLSNSVSSLIRIFSESDPTTPIGEWLPNQLIPTEAKDDHSVDIAGLGIKAILGYARLEAFDWDGTDEFAPVQPDWQFGTGANLLQNPGFENQAFPNSGFEDGNTNYWQPTENDGFLTNASQLNAVASGSAQAGDFYGLVTVGALNRSGAVRTFSGLIPGEAYTITGYLQDPTASGDRWLAGVSGALTANHANAFTTNGYWWAELDNASQGTGSSDGTWQTFTLNVFPETDQITLVIIYSDTGTPLNFWLDSWAMVGMGAGLAPWYSGRQKNLTDIFETSVAQFHSGLQSCRYQGIASVPLGQLGTADNFNYPGICQDVDLSDGAGKTYTCEAWIYHQAGSDQEFTLSLRRQGKSAAFGATDGSGTILFGSGEVSVPTGTWTQIVCSGVSDTDFVTFRVNWKYQGAVDSSQHQSPVFFVDDCSLYEGLPATTLGDILEQIYDHATDPDLRATQIVWDNGQGTDTPYLTLDFDDTVDSNGNAWDTDELTIRLTMRMSYSQIMAEFARAYGYEYRIIPDDVEAGTWLWQVFNPGTMTNDLTTAASPAIQGGASDVRHGTRRTSPGATDLMVEGVDRITGRARSAGLMSALGRIEGGELNRQITEVGAAVAAAETGIETTEADIKSYQYVLVAPQDEPLIDYILGDLVNIVDPPETPLVPARFTDITITVSADSTEYAAQFGSALITSPDAATMDSVAGILRKFEHPDYLGGGGAPIFGGGSGGEMTVTIALLGATQSSIDKADFAVADPNGGFDAELVAALAIVAETGGEIILSEGSGIFTTDTYTIGSSSFPVILRGKGNATKLFFDPPTDFVIAVSGSSRIEKVMWASGGE